MHWHVFRKADSEDLHVFATEQDAVRWIRWAGSLYGKLIIVQCNGPLHVTGACLLGLRRSGLVKEGEDRWKWS